ncbi:MAG: MerR family transcriptional regulator [Alcanivoracaceae bacterium]
MYIGEVVTRTGASAKAIRLYEQRGLLSVPRSGRYRLYRDQDVAQILLIRQALALGFRLADLVALFQDQSQRHGDSGMSRESMLALIDRRIESVDAQLAALTSLRHQLDLARHEIITCPDMAGGQPLNAEVCTTAS